MEDQLAVEKLLRMRNFLPRIIKEGEKDSGVEESRNNVELRAKRSHLSEKDELDLMNTALGCRQFFQYTVFYDEIVDWIEDNNNEDRKLPDMKGRYELTIDWLSQDLFQHGALMDKNGDCMFKSVSELRSGLDRLCRRPGDHFYCFLCKCDVKPMGNYPNIKCPHCDGWFLIEVDKRTDKIVALTNELVFEFRLKPATQVDGQMQFCKPNLTEGSLHSICHPIQCLICFEHSEKDAIELSCGHHYCETCIRTWFRVQGHCNSCPTCSRLMLVEDELYNIWLRSMHFKKNL